MAGGAEQRRTNSAVDVWTIRVNLADVFLSMSAGDGPVEYGTIPRLLTYCLLLHGTMSGCVLIMSVCVLIVGLKLFKGGADGTGSQSRICCLVKRSVRHY